MASSQRGDAMALRRRCESLQQAAVLLLYNMPAEHLENLLCDRRGDLGNDGVPELPVCLRVGDHDWKRIVETHKPSALAWRQTPRALPRLRDKNLRAVLEVSCA